MKTSEIRTAFLEYFREHGHTSVDSSPLVPGNDPSLLFTNAGMVQFKDVFLGLEERDYKRAASSQRCVRAGGKHNDLDNVGYTARHHTFFEMLGNFSFGEYFKKEAIEFAWKLLTERFAIPAEKLWVTVFETDDEAASIWLEHIGIPPERLTRCGEKDNFWMMGDTGPCGPCSEIFYDHGPGVAGGPPGSADADGDRYIEIWNLVFMQYERTAGGEQKRIPRPSVDTGMGLERIAAGLQGVHDNYDIDLFQALIKAVRAQVPGEVLEPASLRVIADHIRAASFLVMDGVLPSNEGRGYVLRRIIRRALRHGHKLGITELFFHKLVPALGEQMGDAYPALRERESTIMAALKLEEERFAETLDHGMRILDASIAEMADDTIAGPVVFQLYDTFGFPVDLTADIARERGLKVDHAGFEAAMQAQRERARAASHFANVDTSHAIDAEELSRIGREQVFTGYGTTHDDAHVVGLFVEGRPVPALAAGTSGVVILDSTPFYAESGGQVGDRGRLLNGNGVFEVADTRKQGGLFLHMGRIQMGTLAMGDKLSAEVEDPRRQATRLNHSATHLMHAALRAVLGRHVEQKGSLVDAERLRFDFSHPQAVSREELTSVERMVNAEIRRNLEVRADVMPYKAAIDSGAMALFGEKYGDEVRVLRMGEFSVELCGGTHVSRSGDIGAFKIVSESGVASGVRRIEAVTGDNAVSYTLDAEARLERIAGLVRANAGEIEPKLKQVVERSRALEKEIQDLKAKLAGASGRDITAGAQDIGGAKLIVEIIEGADMNALRATCDSLKDRFERAVVVLATVEDDKVRLIAGVTKAMTATVHAGDLINHVARQVGGKGGGRPDMAQAGGTDASRLEEAMRSVTPWVTERAAKNP